MTDTERELLDASRELGAPVEWAEWASRELAKRIEATGRAVDGFTVGELRALIREAREGWSAAR